MPPLRTIDRALREITEILACELANPGTTAPRWSQWQWLVARAVASLHGVSPLLAGALRWHDAPQDWAAFLHSQRSHTELRFGRIRDLLSVIDRRARESGIALIALKGAELHALGLYLAGERPMSDIDLLAGEQDMSRTARLLEQLGFRQMLGMARHLVFEPLEHRPPAEFGEHGGNDIKIELHATIWEPLPVDPVDITGFVFPSTPHPGLNRYPSRASLMAHLLIHAAGAMTFNSVRLLQLKDIALLAASMSDSDWHELLGAGISGDCCRWAFPPLQLAARYFSCVPAGVLDITEAWCPRHLARLSKEQRLSDLSYSHLWIEAFPGMPWANSLRERLRYALSRIRPDRETLETRAVLLHSEPRNSQSEWARLSQLRRILRWLASRPPRVETITAVHAALKQSR